MPFVDEPPPPPPDEPSDDAPLPEPDPEPPSDEPGWEHGWEDPGLLPTPEPPTHIPLPDPDPEPVGILIGGSEGLMTKTQTYGGVGANCRSRSTDWGDMASMPYWLEGAVDAPMSGSTVTLTTSGGSESWIPTDSVNAIVAPNSYVELTFTYSAAGATGNYSFFQPTSYTFSVCLEEGDSVSAMVGGDSVQDFSIVKGGTERINFSEIATANAVWTEFTISIRIDKAVHCAYDAEAEPDQWTGTADEEGAIDDENGSGGGDGAGAFDDCTQTDSREYLGALVVILLARFVIDTTRGGECD